MLLQEQETGAIDIVNKIREGDIAKISQRELSAEVLSGNMASQFQEREMAELCTAIKGPSESLNDISVFEN